MSRSWIAIVPKLLTLAVLSLLLAATPVRAFDAYGAEVLGLRLGMTRAQVVARLEENSMQIGGNYTRGQERKLGTETLLLPTLEGETLEFRLKEYTAGGRYPSFNLNFTYPTPGDPQVLWAFQYLTQFGEDTPAEVVMNSVLKRYGQPAARNTSADGLETYLYYGSIRFKPYFDDRASAASGNTGMYVRIRAPDGREPGLLEIQLGDHSLWQAKEQNLDTYKKVYARQQRDGARKTEEISGQPKF